MHRRQWLAMAMGSLLWGQLASATDPVVAEPQPEPDLFLAEPVPAETPSVSGSPGKNRAAVPNSGKSAAAQLRIQQRAAREARDRQARIAARKKAGISLQRPHRAWPWGLNMGTHERIDQGISRHQLEPLAQTAPGK